MTINTFKIETMKKILLTASFMILLLLGSCQQKNRGSGSHSLMVRIDRLDTQITGYEVGDNYGNLPGGGWIAQGTLRSV